MNRHSGLRKRYKRMRTAQRNNRSLTQESEEVKREKSSRDQERNEWCPEVKLNQARKSALELQTLLGHKGSSKKS